MKYKTLPLLFLTLGFFLLFPVAAGTQSGNPIALVEAFLCEDIQDNVPQNRTTVFSIERRTAVCYTAFDPVPQQAVIYHQWFHRDKPSARIRLTATLVDLQQYPVESRRHRSLAGGNHRRPGKYFSRIEI